MKNLLFYFLAFSLAVTFVGCDDEDDTMNPTGGDAPIASFQFAINPDNFAEVTFTNFSQNADSYEWDFGDGNSSTDENPVYVYGAGGNYTVVLTASSGNESATFSQSFEIIDPGDAAALLNGGSSKTWKLFREGISMSVGPNMADPQAWWPGLSNDGSRPCMYQHEFTFTSDGQYIVDDKGMYWAEFGLFNNVAGCSMDIEFGCYDSTAGMFNACGDDVSAFGSGTHQYTYDASTGSLTLTGMGAWIGIPKLGTTGEVIVPQPTTTASISFESFTGYDIMTVVFDYGDGSGYWPIQYVSYSDASLEPELQTEFTGEEFGEDLPDITPDELYRSFASNEASEWILLDTITSGSQIEYGVDNPTDPSGEKVGLYTRIEAEFQELQFQTSPEKNDINFANINTISLDVYMPSTNEYAEGALTTGVNIGIADASQVEQWWTDFTQYENDGSTIPLDEWTTLTFDVNAPNLGPNPQEREGYDMIFISIGGNAHFGSGTFYVRDFRLN